MMNRRKANSDSGLEALRVLKLRLSDVVYATLRTDATIKPQPIAARQTSQAVGSQAAALSGERWAQAMLSS